MRILLVSGPGISLKEPFDSGIEAFMVSFANQLINEGHIVDIIAAEADVDSKFTLINPFIESTSDTPNALECIREERQFRAMHIDQYDLIHYNMFYPHLLSAGLNFNKPSFLTLHSPADETRVSTYKQLSSNGKLKLVAISERIKSQWDEALGQDIPLINNGINMDIWPAKNSAKREYLLWSARINQKKNVADAIKLAKHMQLPLKIAGRIVDQSYFDDEVRPHLGNQIKYVGHLTQSELSRLSHRASAYLATATWQEPFGLAALEMLASGIPVVGYNTAVPPNWANESVFTTDSLRWQDLIRLVEQSYSISSETCRKFASSMSIQQMTVDYIKLYREALSQEANGDEIVGNHSLPVSLSNPQTL
ncbi:glycosyltransferase [Pedobacter sp. G11]|uniref:glycosyltransferase n=1 Tax=Pedobacter sp. G11 TaxID=2482728 RepID=UPI000F5E9420|nr:glycosyltransferase [Pedobacter sp. G11]AZI26832.1 glycosyltransferase [Pedobacter sp. G11]